MKIEFTEDELIILRDILESEKKIVEYLDEEDVNLFWSIWNKIVS